MCPIVPDQFDSKSLYIKAMFLFSQMGPFEVFAYGPTLKFKLSWSGAPLARPPKRPTSLPLRAPLTSQNSASTNDVRTPSEEANGSTESRKKQRVFYQFIYNNNTRQQTEARDDFFCPWCSIDCRGLYSLLKHLKLCHRRFIFTYAVSILIKGCFMVLYVYFHRA